MGTGLGNRGVAEPRAPNRGAGPHPRAHPLSLRQDLLVLRLVKELEPGEYSVFLRLTDGQGKAQVTPVRAQVCDCEGPAKNCGRENRLAFTQAVFHGTMPEGAEPGESGAAERDAAPGRRQGTGEMSPTAARSQAAPCCGCWPR